MDHREKILEMIFEHEPEEFMDWIMSFDALDQVELMRQVKELLLIMADDMPDNKEVRQLITTYSEQIENYQEAVLDELLAKQEMIMAQENTEKLLKEMDVYALEMRPYVIECILTNADNAEEMRKLAQAIIEFEKQRGTYDSNNWKQIL